MKCLITYKFEEREILTTIRLGIDKIVVMSALSHIPSSKMLNNLGIEIEEKTSEIKAEDKIGDIVHSTLNLISTAKEEGYEPIILPPHDRRFSIGMYIAACIEKAKIIAIESGEEMDIEEMPIFPFVTLKHNELFVLDEIYKQKDKGKWRISTKGLFKSIERDGNLDMLYTSFREADRNEGASAYRQLLRILERLRELNLVNRYEYGRSINWESTEFAEIFKKSHS